MLARLRGPRLAGRLRAGGEGAARRARFAWSTGYEPDEVAVGFALAFALHLIPVGLIFIKASSRPPADVEVEPPSRTGDRRLDAQARQAPRPEAAPRPPRPARPARRPTRRSSRRARSRRSSRDAGAPPPPDTKNADIQRLIAKTDPFAEDGGKDRPRGRAPGGGRGGTETDPNKVHAGDLVRRRSSRSSSHDRWTFPSVISQGEAEPALRHVPGRPSARAWSSGTSEEQAVKKSGNDLFDDSARSVLQKLLDDRTALPDPPDAVADAYRGKTVNIVMPGGRRCRNATECCGHVPAAARPAAGRRRRGRRAGLGAGGRADAVHARRRGDDDGRRERRRDPDPLQDRPRRRSSATPARPTTVVETESRDFTLSSLFQVLDPASFTANLAAEGTGIDPASWRNVGAEGVVKGSRRSRAAGSSTSSCACSSCRAARDAVLKQGVRRARRRSVRGAVHQFDNEVVKWFTGTPGSFGTRMVFSATTGRGQKGIFAGRQRRAGGAPPPGRVQRRARAGHRPGRRLLLGRPRRRELLALQGRATRRRSSSARGSSSASRSAAAKMALVVSQGGQSDIFVGNAGRHRRSTKVTQGGLNTAPRVRPGRRARVRLQRRRQPADLRERQARQLERHVQHGADVVQRPGGDEASSTWGARGRPGTSSASTRAGARRA